MSFFWWENSNLNALFFWLQVLESVLSMPPTTHVAVRHVGLRLVGELAEWMDQQPQYLDRVLNWLLAGLQVCNKLTYTLANGYF